MLEALMTADCPSFPGQVSWDIRGTDPYASMTDAFAQARALIEQSTALAVLTGAGISAESGIPTFRDALTGLWENFRPEELATPEAFEANPKLVWDWYAWRRERVVSAVPNAGHRALVEMERRCQAREVDFTLVTQNVDGLHGAAGSRRVVELHGNIRRVKCFANHHAVETWAASETVPSCPQCGSLLRPDVVWFGEVLPHEALAAAVAAARTCDVFLCVGTSTVVEPAASLPFLALQAGARVIEVNPQETSLTRLASVSLRGNAGEILPRLA
jgi:NAD-dependent deacetylase